MRYYRETYYYCDALDKQLTTKAMRNIFEVPQGKEVNDNTPSIECIEVTNKDRRNYIDKHIVAVIVTPLGSTIEIADNRGYVVAVHSEYCSSEYVTSNLLDALRQLHKAVDMNKAIVVSNSLYFGERLIDLTTIPHNSPLGKTMPQLSIKGFSVSYNNTDNN